MRILHTISSVDSTGGGPIEAIRQLSMVHNREGHEIEVASTDESKSHWVREFPFKVHALGPGHGKFRYSSRFVPWLKQNYHRYDAVVINGLWQYSGWGAWRALPRGYPYFVYPHGMLDPWFKKTYPLKHLKKWLYWPWADYRVLRDAAAVLFTCEQERVLARQSFWLYQCHEEVVGLGTPRPEGNPVDQRERFLERYPELRGKRCLLFLGRVHVKKGPDLLLQAFKNIMDSEPSSVTSDVHLVMAGPHDHAYGAEMLALAKSLRLEDRITWTGMLTGDLKWGAFRAADAFILPSHQENFGIAVAEALACSVPVLISDQVNIWREVKEFDAGFVEADTVEGTTKMLRQWLHTLGADLAKMKVNALECFASKFHIEQAARSLLRVMQSHVGKNGAEI